MGVQRKDITEKKGLYDIRGKDGLWRIHDCFEMPTIQMINMESGELFNMKMASMDNIRSKLIREIKKSDKMPAPWEIKERIVEKEVPVPIEIEKESQEALEQIEQLQLIVLDASVMIGEVLAVDRPKKAQRDQMQAWFDQIVELTAEWGIELPDNLKDKSQNEETEDTDE